MSRLIGLLDPPRHSGCGNSVGVDGVGVGVDGRDVGVDGIGVGIDGISVGVGIVEDDNTGLQVGVVKREGCLNISRTEAHS
jgi:hypothetical protein